MALPPWLDYPDLLIILRELQNYYSDPRYTGAFPSVVNIATAVTNLPPLACFSLGTVSLSQAYAINQLQKTEAHFGSATWPTFFLDAAQEYEQF